ncbi:hypothetical protein [Actinomadura sp. 21ATH]|uniref:hypothetical protein n=1 Tax=Actinomadura sp. 21ATH TaxID=1735444 RepID=UPI0035BF3A92
MTTVVLVLLCLAIAGRELYLASDKRLPRAQAELRELRSRIHELGKRHDALQAELAELRDTPAITIPQPAARAEEPPAPPAEPPPGSLYAADRPPAEVAELAGRVDRLEERLGAVSAELAGAELDRAARHALARSLDAAEQVVGELRREMLERLGREEGVVSGLLLSEEGEAEALLADAYERCSGEYGLRVRIRDQRSVQTPGGAFWGTSYHLSGRRADALAEELFTYVRDLRDPHDPSALAALLAELAHLAGGGIARIGAFTAVRTSTGLVCGLLPDDVPESAEPWEPATRIRELPADLQADLSWLC